MTDAQVRVEVVELDAGGSRQISSVERATELLAGRADDIRSAIKQASEIARAGVADLDDAPGWRVCSLEATFGLTLTAETGVIVAKGSVEAAFEIKLTIDRH